ncbi:MAG: hypothetical protein HQL69_19100 [Magnetococcales bacterium]|nr:hypothetical protein [Magnetococcales bacterium]
MKKVNKLIILLFAIALSACSYPAHQSGGGVSEYFMGSAHTKYGQESYQKSESAKKSKKDNHPQVVYVVPYAPHSHVQPVYMPVQ